MKKFWLIQSMEFTESSRLYYEAMELYHVAKGELRTKLHRRDKTTAEFKLQLSSFSSLGNKTPSTDKKKSVVHSSKENNKIAEEVDLKNYWKMVLSNDNEK